ncbi:hypothetical protein [Streptomyces marispadix]|uniref:Uncharacterized protein n=1 Tax=Streptomyces marispadix TaxID=2922868 RepID=A0ABS9T3V8_9ACTN|nr:hypothetical protein [Streptomyces marispadix]MCH6163133.1 hypothetical protein [Streptomyces marispadix]
MPNPPTPNPAAAKPLRRPTVVPFIARWSAEDQAPRPQVVERKGRIAFVHERRYDRDAHGVLWDRVPFQPGKGVPQFGRLHPLRQRNAMELLLCHVCGDPADRDPDGVLWLLAEALDPAAGPGPGGIVTEHPPVCLPCAHIAVRECPRLRAGFTAVRVRAVEQAGVCGALYRPGSPRPVPVDAVSVTFDNPAIGWVRAGKLLLRLTDYRLVDLGHKETRPSKPLSKPI